MKILITGATGTIGTELTNLFLKDGHEVVGLSRDEFKQHHWPFKNKAQLFIGDIRSLDDCVQASAGCDLIIHTAALKHVDKMELNPTQSVQTNIIGTYNLVKARKLNRVDRITLLSTDKAVYPINVYGNSKAIAERFVLQDEGMVIRYGNVLGSRGSVIETFSKALKESNVVPITHMAMTRFFITINRAANFINEIGSDLTAQPGLYVPYMKACLITDLAKAVARNLGPMAPQDDIDFRVTGMRPGEKINECLFSRYEKKLGYYENFKGDLYSDTADQMGQSELDMLVNGEA